mmetsp:Transcript_34842/g.84384  ORF Transcript_34842/g.84384 Transcript_34842/m.84384 type:complete len:180 (+) Transcript_34842:134-673(+)|eukprot:CAMPEP_0113625896 /NCGR_PEP_ID=MMETSP0017_2-20120614/13381_1 /TAXON_ID=2856 /ORGANISM="Cylindrotheca closterium" /LENGTH=179 /DNA_ID=CAMNT_0000536035 /DNA_START=77 /DNA_END=616 /DNA_ORIENTATION=+ /assembly_acc=CAM_ASM_000147
MTKNSTVPDSPLATFMKGLIDSKNFASTEIVTDNPRRLSHSSSVRTLLQSTGESQRWESCEKNESEGMNCPQRRLSIDDDDLFSDFEGSSCCEDENDDDDMHSHSNSTPRPRAPMSPPFASYEKDGMQKDDTSSLQYQMALRMVQQKYSATSISSPTQSPLQPPKKLCPGSRSESSFRR